MSEVTGPSSRCIDFALCIFIRSYLSFVWSCILPPPSCPFHYHSLSPHHRAIGNSCIQQANSAETTISSRATTKSSLVIDSYRRMAASGVQQQRQHQQQQSDGMRYGSSFQHQHGISMGETTCRATPIHTEVFAEISTSGARAAIHFVEESSAFRGLSRSSSSYRSSPSSRSGTRRQPGLWRDTRGVQSSPAVIGQQRQTVVAQPAVIREQPMATSLASVSSYVDSRSPGKHHRRTSTPLDGAYLTLLGVSTGLKTPGVDNWTVAGALVESSVDLRTRNVKGMTPLHLACSAGQVRHHSRTHEKNIFARARLVERYICISFSTMRSMGFPLKAVDKKSD